ncbi:CLUMA_CG014371, isoform A [Clunio marinus]|uniref:CLUMA_CG014371, isoform A n=1 Tax=Clunio marinus TaxID=568069 RepID=A0A1J1IRD4_9DIPT|nr:CLUMA_CG014371, isoform A [Clunio marinus]
MVTPQENISPKLPEGLRKNMEKFQARNGLPVFLKGGPFDKILFGTTVFLCGVGLLMSAEFIYSLSKKK